MSSLFYPEIYVYCCFWSVQQLYQGHYTRVRTQVDREISVVEEYPLGNGFCACLFLDPGPKKSIFNFTGAASTLKFLTVTQITQQTTKCLLKEEKEEREEEASPTARSLSPSLPRYVIRYCIIAHLETYSQLHFRLDYNSQLVVLVVS